MRGHVTQVPLFLAAGGFAAAVNWGSRFLFSRWMPFEAAIVVAYGVGMVTAFVLMRTFVFDGGEKPVGSQAARFTLVNGVALAQTFLVSVGLARWLLPSIGVQEHAEALGHLAGVATPAITSYFGHRLYTFR